MLAILDEFTRLCLALEAHTRIKSLRVQEVLERLFGERDPPAFLRSENGSEFISRSLGVCFMPKRREVSLHQSWSAVAERLRGELQFHASKGKS